jgi:hypothetical protein
MAFVIPFIFTVQYLHLYGSIVDPHCRKMSKSNVEQCRCGFGSGSVGSDPAKRYGSVRNRRTARRLREKPTHVDGCRLVGPFGVLQAQLQNLLSGIRTRQNRLNHVSGNTDFGTLPYHCGKNAVLCIQCGSGSSFFPSMLVRIRLCRH